jgi:hypothetical protein
MEGLHVEASGRDEEAAVNKSGMYLYILLLVSMWILAGCAPASEGVGEPSGNLAFVDVVTVETQDEHFYTKVEGHYPDACSRVSQIDQSFDGSTFKIDLYVDRPEDMICAQMLTPFTVHLLLEVGGVSPGEYTIQVNERSDSFTLGP